MFAVQAVVVQLSYSTIYTFGTVYHIHDRYPPDKLEYVGNVNSDKDIYSEWFNGVKIPEENLENYKVIFIYRTSYSSYLQ